MSEKPAKGTRGFLLHTVTQGFFFRVYDPADKSKFVDYEPSSKCCHRCGWKDKTRPFLTEYSVVNAVGWKWIVT